MKHFVIVILAAVAVMFTAAPAANAAPIRNCGDMGYSIRNITTRGLPCHGARLAVKHDLSEFWGYNRAHTERRYGWTCRATPLPRYVVDVRCTVGSVVVRFQYQSGE
jgi:hypothetical protein